MVEKVEPKNGEIIKNNFSRTDYRSNQIIINLCRENDEIYIWRYEVVTKLNFCLLY